MVCSHFRLRFMLAMSTTLPVTLQIYFCLQPWCQHCKLMVLPPSYSGLSSLQTVYHHTMSLSSITHTKTTPNVTYVMSHGQAVQGLYDYSTNMGTKQWVEATKPLGDKPYDGSSKGSSHFLSNLSLRALDS